MRFRGNRTQENLELYIACKKKYKKLCEQLETDYILKENNRLRSSLNSTTECWSALKNIKMSGSVHANNMAR